MSRIVPEIKGKRTYCLKNYFLKNIYSLSN